MSGQREERDIRLELEKISQELRQSSLTPPISTRHSALGVIETAISDLQSKERELASAISLSKLLLAHNHSLSRDLQSALQAKLHLEAVICALRQELRRSKEETDRVESRYKALEARLREEGVKQQLEGIAQYVQTLESEVAGLRKKGEKCEVCQTHSLQASENYVKRPGATSLCADFCTNSDSEALTDTGSLSHRHPSLSLSLSTRDSLSVPGRPRQRLSPGEEYFTLVTQGVKMNIEGGGREVATKLLYEKAMKEDVTFDKWHRWVEEQLQETSGVSRCPA